jgi:Tol biopolymer transport system component
MTLAAGFRLGPYEIVTPIGAGGMGEVYRARDARLGRDVAIKVLPVSFSNDPDRLRRFEQEAHAAGVLNHPNVTAVYDIGTFDGSPYVVSELLEGETLRSRLAGGALTPRRAIDYAVQIAHGLAAAHEKGIVHRDLKPENLFVTKDGRVKILDFGLAKLTQPESAGPQTNLPTETAGTEPGVVLGTLGYMSPEQVRGRTADPRSDIFSLGAILYEMLSGKRAFHRDTAADTMSAILREEPADLSSTNRQISPAIDRIIRHCLEKDPEARFHSAHDLGFDLETVLGGGLLETQVPVSAARPARRARILVVAAASLIALLVGAALATLALRPPQRERPPQVVRLSIPVPPGTTYAPSEISRGISISPDGTRVVVEAYLKGRRHLYIRPLDSEKFTELEGSEGASTHFWSPDSRFIAFFADRKLKKIPAEGGPPEELCAADFQILGTWNREGMILFAQLSPTGILRVSDKGGDPVEILTSDPQRGEVALFWPYFLPDGRRFLYQASRGEAEARDLRVGRLDSKESRVVGSLYSRVEYAPSGHLVYAREGALFAQPFDEKNAVLTGEPRLLADSVHYFYGPSHASFSVSQTGAIAYETARPPSRLVWYDRAGNEVGTLGRPSVTKGFRLSPDGMRAAVAIEDPRYGTADIWVYELQRGVSTRLHSNPVDENSPAWSADGSKLFYRSDHKGPPDVYEIGVGAPGSERLVFQDFGVQQPEDVSRDGRLLVYLNNTQVAADIRILPLVGKAVSSTWLHAPFNLSNPRFSPDGRWIAYDSDESGDVEIYVARTEGGGEKQRLSPQGGRQPRWRGDGKELYYVAPDGTLMAVPLALGTRLESGAPRALFRVETDVENYDPSPDGSRFLVSTRISRIPESPLRVILNWDAGLKKER